MKARHPEKINNPVNPIKKKPEWIKTKIINSKAYFTTKQIVNKMIAVSRNGSKRILNFRLEIASDSGGLISEISV